MKYVAFLMTVIVFAMTCLPCRDHGHVAAENRMHVATIAAGSQAQQQGEDDCSPFCVCACCGYASCIHCSLLEAGSPPPHWQSVLYSRYVPQVQEATPFPLLQPPRLA